MDKDTIQGYRLATARKYGINVAIIYDRIAFWSDKGGRRDGYIFKTYKEMEDETALTERQIRLAYEKLESLKVIETKIIKANGYPTKHFRFLRNVRNDTDETSETMDTDETSETSNMINHDKQNKDIHFDGPNNSAEPAADGRTGALALPLLEQVIQIINPKEKPTADRLRVLNGRLKDYTSDEILGSARAFSKSQWHRENKQMSVDNLLAPSKFGRWYAVRDDQPVSEFVSENVTIENQDEMVRRRMGDGDGSN